MRHHVLQVKIISAPQVDKLRPGSLLIMIRAHPAVLIVTRENQIVLTDANVKELLA